MSDLAAFGVCLAGFSASIIAGCITSIYRPRTATILGHLAGAAIFLAAALYIWVQA